MDILSSDDLFYLANELQHDDLIRFCQTNRQYAQIWGVEGVAGDGVPAWKDRVLTKYDKKRLPWDLTWQRFDDLLEKEKIKFIPMAFAEDFESTAVEEYLRNRGSNENGGRSTICVN